MQHDEKTGKERDTLIFAGNLQKISSDLSTKRKVILCSPIFEDLAKRSLVAILPGLLIGSC